MSIGDVTNPKRVRTQSNERLDTVDSDALSLVPRDHLDAYSRAVEATPRNAGSSTPTGLIFQGFGLSLNPTAPNDAKVRVGSPLGVAFDSNGRLLIKELGVQVDLTLPSGNSQVYVYYSEVTSDVAVRRAISVGSPFVESPLSLPTKFKGSVAFFTRAGDQTSIVASDIVNGATTALCFLGVASNSAGTITMTGYDVVSAPNGAFVTNRITSVAAPATLPPASTANGSVATMHGLANAALYMVGQAVWKGSKNFTPSAANNFGAFTAPAVGVDGLFDSQGELAFAPTTKWRDWQQNTRFLVDHQGLPGGQISVKDEHWFTPNNPSVALTMGTDVQTVSIDPSSGFKVAGSAAANTSAPFGVSLTTSGDQWLVPISGIPVGAVILRMLVWNISGSASNTLTMTLSATTLLTGASVNSEVRTLTTLLSSHAGTDVMSGTGSGAKVVRDTEKLHLSLTCTIAAASVNAYSIQVFYVLPPDGWSSVLATTDLVVAGDAARFGAPFSGLNQRGVNLLSTATGSVAGKTDLVGAPEVWVDSDLEHSTEFMIKTGTVVDGTNAAVVTVLVQTQAGKGWGLHRPAGSANWKLRLIDDSNDQLSDTGVAFANDTLYRVKIEYQGANRRSSGPAAARLWINGTNVANLAALAALTPSAAGMLLRCSASSVSATTPYDITVGRLHRAWNHLAAGDNV